MVQTLFFFAIGPLSEYMKFSLPSNFNVAKTYPTDEGEEISKCPKI